MDRTNAERQRRYIQRLKERARGVSNVSNAPSDAALTQELAQAKRAAGPRPGHASASWRWRWARAQATNRELKAALEAAKSAKNLPRIRRSFARATPRPSSTRCSPCWRRTASRMI